MWSDLTHQPVQGRHEGMNTTPRLSIRSSAVPSRPKGSLGRAPGGFGGRLRQDAGHGLGVVGEASEEQPVDGATQIGQQSGARTPAVDDGGVVEVVAEGGA